MELNIDEIKLMLGDREIKLYIQAKDIIKLKQEVAELKSQILALKEQ